MANIDIERRKGTNTLVWVLAAIVVIALLAWLFWPRDAAVQETGAVSQAAAATMLWSTMSPTG